MSSINTILFQVYMQFIIIIEETKKYKLLSLEYHRFIVGTHGRRHCTVP